MEITLSAELSHRWDEGNWAAWAVEQDIIERLIEQDIVETVVVLLDTGAVAFAVTPPGVA